MTDGSNSHSEEDEKIHAFLQAERIRLMNLIFVQPNQTRLDGRVKQKERKL